MKTPIALPHTKYQSGSQSNGKNAKLLSVKPKNARIHSVDKVQNFLKSSYEELKRVTWPSKKEAIRLTGYVIGVSFGVGLFVMLLDYVFAQMLALLLTK